ncbi:hypothetical protein GCM10028773_64290 [Spirosoma koreense]
MKPTATPTPTDFETLLIRYIRQVSKTYPVPEKMTRELLREIRAKKRKPYERP